MSNKNYNNAQDQDNNELSNISNDSTNNIITVNNELPIENNALTQKDENIIEDVKPVELVDNIKLDTEETVNVEEGNNRIIENTHDVLPTKKEVNKEVKPITKSSENKSHTSKTKDNIKFYKVGTDYIRNKCINQVIATSDLDNAKDACDSSRNNKHKTYYVFDRDGNVVYTSEYNIPRDNYYRVGTDFKNGRCVDQKYYTVKLDDACKVSNESTKTTGMIHHVFDPSGKIVFSSKKKLTLLSYKKREVNKNADWYFK
jgi:hypothetical protein